MVDTWRRWWDERVKETGDPGRVPRLLTDEQLLALLRKEAEGRRESEKRLLADEVLRRLGRARAADAAPASDSAVEPPPDVCEPPASQMPPPER